MRFDIGQIGLLQLFRILVCERSMIEFGFDQAKISLDAQSTGRDSAPDGRKSKSLSLETVTIRLFKRYSEFLRCLDGVLIRIAKLHRTEGWK
jgi:hypothetical protein